jgi:hypothetical protein
MATRAERSRSGVNGSLGNPGGLSSGTELPSGSRTSTSTSRLKALNGKKVEDELLMDISTSRSRTGLDSDQDEGAMHSMDSLMYSHTTEIEVSARGQGLSSAEATR